MEAVEGMFQHAYVSAYSGEVKWERRIHPCPITPDSQCSSAIACTQIECINELKTGRFGWSMNTLTDGQTDRHMTCEASCTASPFIAFSLSTIFESTHWFHLARLMLGVAQWQEKGNQNQMGPGLASLPKPPLVPPGAGCWLVAAQEERSVNQAMQVWSAAQLTTAQPASL